MTNKPIDKIVLAIVVLLLASVAVLNICQTERPTVSETENRNLATMPEFSVDTLLSGEYFADIGDFISDTFLQRDALVSISKKMDTLKSLSLIRPQEGISVIIDPNPGKTEAPEELTLPTLPPLPTVPTTEAPPETTAEPTVETTVPNDVPTVIPITLSADSASFTTDASYVLTATVGAGYENLHWDISGSNDITITDNGDNTVTVTGTAAGNAVITAIVTGFGETHYAQCEITVKPLVIEPPQVKPVDFLPNGMIVYDGAAYSQSYFSSAYAPAFAQLYDLYAQLFPKSRMSVVIAPLSTITITDPSASVHISDQGDILDKLEAEIIGNVNFVNLKKVFLDHADEYLFFRSDHHWTHRGAYYAYSEFAKSVGIFPTPLHAFKKEVLVEGFIGSMYDYTGDDRIGRFFDTVEAYMPNKAHNMKIIFGSDSVTEKDSCVLPQIQSYVAFLAGDNPYTVINVPENPQDKSILVIKDSYGNAFVPYLTEHYGNIVVVDPRHGDMNIHDFYNTYQFTDIVFMVNTTSANSASWYNYLASLLN